MRGLGFVFLAACSFDPSGAQNTEVDGPVAHDAAIPTHADAAPIQIDAGSGLPGPPMGSGCDMDGNGMGPIGFGGGHHGCCGNRCGP